MIFAGSFMQALVNKVMIACGLNSGNAEWTSSGLWAGENFSETLRVAQIAYRRKPKWVKPTEPIFTDERIDITEDHPSDRWLTIYRIERQGKLVHISRTLENAMREIAWRDWMLGCDGVAIVPIRRKGATIYGATGHPHRYGAPWPKAKLDEFARLYQSDMSLRELEEYFDTASSQLGKKRADLGLRKRR
jgi:hypothetical protein